MKKVLFAVFAIFVLASCQKEEIVVPQNGGCTTVEVENYITTYDTVSVVTPSGDTIITVTETEVYTIIRTETCNGVTTTTNVPGGTQQTGQWSNFYSEWHILSNPFAAGWDGLYPVYVGVVEEYIDGYNYGQPVWKRTGATDRGLIFDPGVKGQISGYFAGATIGRMSVVFGGYVSDYNGYEIVSAGAPAQ